MADILRQQMKLCTGVLRGIKMVFLLKQIQRNFDKIDYDVRKLNEREIKIFFTKSCSLRNISKLNHDIPEVTCSERYY